MSSKCYISNSYHGPTTAPRPAPTGTNGIDPALLIDFDIKEQALVEKLLVIRDHWVRSVIERFPDGQ